jgi:hypothetical protein
MYQDKIGPLPLLMNVKGAAGAEVERLTMLHRNITDCSRLGFRLNPSSAAAASLL